MDPADSDSEPARLRKAIASQGDFLGQHEQALQDLNNNNQAMMTQISQLTEQVARLTSSDLASPAQPARSGSTSDAESNLGVLCPESRAILRGGE